MTKQRQKIKNCNSLKTYLILFVFFLFTNLIKNSLFILLDSLILFEQILSLQTQIKHLTNLVEVYVTSTNFNFDHIKITEELLKVDTTKTFFLKSFVGFLKAFSVFPLLGLSCLILFSWFPSASS